MIAFIERHWKVGRRTRHWPRRNSLSLIAINDCDMTGLRHVNKNPRPLDFQLERLRMRSKRDFAQSFLARWIDNADRAAARATKTNIEPFLLGIVSQIIRIGRII